MPFNYAPDSLALGSGQHGPAGRTSLTGVRHAAGHGWNGDWALSLGAQFWLSAGIWDDARDGLAGHLCPSHLPASSQPATLRVAGSPPGQLTSTRRSIQEEGSGLSLQARVLSPFCHSLKDLRGQQDLGEDPESPVSMGGVGTNSWPPSISFPFWYHV